MDERKFPARAEVNTQVDDMIRERTLEMTEVVEPEETRLQQIWHGLGRAANWVINHVPLK